MKNLSVPAMTGLDVDPVSVRIARDMAEVWADQMPVSFCEGSVECMPFGAGSFDVVTARLLLPYVEDVAGAVRQIAVALRKEGIVIFQVHSFRYYWNGIFSRSVKPWQWLYSLRAICGGLYYALTGARVFHRLCPEIAVPLSVLRRQCRRFGLSQVWSGGFDLKPLVAFRRIATDMAM